MRHLRGDLSRARDHAGAAPALAPEAKAPRVLNEAAIFKCIACGKPLGTEKMIDDMLAKLAGHSMFAAPGALDRLKMCADCRVVDLMKQRGERCLRRRSPRRDLQPEDQARAEFYALLARLFAGAPDAPLLARSPGAARSSRPRTKDAASGSRPPGTRCALPARAMVPPCDRNTRPSSSASAGAK